MVQLLFLGGDFGLYLFVLEPVLVDSAVDLGVETTVLFHLCLQCLSLLLLLRALALYFSLDST